MLQLRASPVNSSSTCYRKTENNKLVLIFLQTFDNLYKLRKNLHTTEFTQDVVVGLVNHDPEWLMSTDPRRLDSFLVEHKNFINVYSHFSLISFKSGTHVSFYNSIDKLDRRIQKSLLLSQNEIECLGKSFEFFLHNILALLEKQRRLC